MGDEQPPPSLSVPCHAWRRGEMSVSVRAVPEETAIAFTFNGTTHAVMMATPGDLDDFAVGFALTEGLIESSGEIDSLDIVTTPLGIELRVLVAGRPCKNLCRPPPQHGGADRLRTLRHRKSRGSGAPRAFRL